MWLTRALEPDVSWTTAALSGLAFDVLYGWSSTPGADEESSNKKMCGAVIADDQQTILDAMA